MTTYTARITGTLWQGCKGNTDLTFNHQPTQAEVMERAGDFQQVTSIRLTKTTVTVEKCRLADQPILHGSAQFEDCHKSVRAKV